MLWRHALAAALPALLLFGACFRRDEDPEPEPVECMLDGDCALLDDGDSCFAPAFCDVTHTCVREFLQDFDECQCDFDGDCPAVGFEELGCNLIDCVRATHQCREEIVPEGPAPQQDDGDCVEVECDGTNAEGIELEAPDDFDDDQNECTVDACTPDGPTHDPLADGDTCLDQTGVCYDATCFPGCVPARPEACGSEGSNEPGNDAAISASTLNETSGACGMLDGDDVDWYTGVIVDGDFESDVLTFDVHATAPVVEICAFVQCVNHLEGGRPEGGCDDKLAGPVTNSEGCCWSGAPTTVKASWDVDCSDTSDDSGTLHFSVRALESDACETYTLTALY